jgi:PAS domain-containing protein
MRSARTSGLDGFRRPRTCRRHSSRPHRHPQTAGETSHDSFDANISTANVPDPVFVSGLEGKILQANEAVSQLLGFRQDELRAAVPLLLAQPRGDLALILYLLFRCGDVVSVQRPAHGQDHLLMSLFRCVRW